MKFSLKPFLMGGLFAYTFVVALMLAVEPALAATFSLPELPGFGGADTGDTTVNQVGENIVESAEELPGLISAIAYLIGLLLGITGVLKLKDHVENPNQTPLRTSMIRLIAGGALFALPTVIEAVWTTIGTDGLAFDPEHSSLSTMISDFAGSVGMLDINHLLQNFVESTKLIPAVIAAVAYLLGLLMTVIGILKIKDHVEQPEQTQLKEGVIRLLVGGALFALPTVYNAMTATIAGDGDLGTLGDVTEILGGLGFVYSSYAIQACDPTASTGGAIADVGALVGLGDGGGTSFGQLVCGIVFHAGAIPAFFTALAYLLGLCFGLWGILKLRDHVLNPMQVGLWEGVSRLLAGGAFFALPFVVEIARNAIGAGLFTATSMVATTGYNEAGAAACGGGGGAMGVGGAIGAAWDWLTGGGDDAAEGGSMGLDCMLANFMGDVMAPIHAVLNFFCFCAGIIFILIGISRLIKSAQDGARGPGGLGTIMTFVIGSALISYNEILQSVSSSLFGNPLTFTYATLSYADGMGEAEAASAHLVISAILKFVIIVGLISFVRGMFIIRSVADGNQQASIMAGVTHMVAGAVAVNLGPLINAVQSTLGIGGYGIVFDGGGGAGLIGAVGGIFG